MALLQTKKLITLGVFNRTKGLGYVKIIRQKFVSLVQIYIQ